jgi:5-formyltetrahydrofolate cyclo-ligase
MAARNAVKTDMKSVKAAFRMEIKKLMNALDENYIENSNKRIYDNVSVLKEITAADVIFIYCSMGRK